MKRLILIIFASVSFLVSFAQAGVQTFPVYKGDTLKAELTMEKIGEDSLWNDVSQKVYYSHFQDTLSGKDISKISNLFLDWQFKRNLSTSNESGVVLLKKNKEAKRLPVFIFYMWSQADKCWYAKNQTEISTDSITHSQTIVEYRWNQSSSKWIPRSKIIKSYDVDWKFVYQNYSEFDEDSKTWIFKGAKKTKKQRTICN